jgi:hypothetical protein
MKNNHYPQGDTKPKVKWDKKVLLTLKIKTG